MDRTGRVWLTGQGFPDGSGGLHKGKAFRMAAGDSAPALYVDLMNMEALKDIMSKPGLPVSTCHSWIFICLIHLDFTRGEGQVRGSVPGAQIFGENRFGSKRVQYSRFPNAKSLCRGYRSGSVKICLQFVGCSSQETVFRSHSVSCRPPHGRAIPVGLVEEK